MPMWSNRGEGVAAANGTTTHTVTIPFTPTSGRLLVAIMGGAVTFTTPTGWTAGPSQVNAQGLYVFTKTSDGTETSLSTTHNGTNYPIAWVIYEFASGSALTGTAGTGTNVAVGATTWATVTALPGTAVTVFGAATQAALPATTSNASTFTAPWLEDVDSFTAAGASTEGAYLAVGYQDGITATSATPVGSVTGTGTTGVGERLAFGVNAVVLLAAPTVDALGDRYLALGATLDRTATVAANGATVTAQGWTLESGTGSPATLSSSTVLSWTPSQTGVYGLRFSATNSQGTTTQNITITVVEAALNSNAMASMRPRSI